MPEPTPAPRGARWRRTRRVGLICLELAAGATVAVGVLAVVARSVAIGWQPAIIVAAVSVYFAVAALVGGLVLAWRRRRVGAVVAAVVAVWTVVVHIPLYVAAAPRSGVPLVVLQANLKVGGADASSLVERVRALHVDLLTVDELTPDAADRLTAAGLDAVLTHRFITPYPGGAGTGIWSRHPLSQTVAHDEFAFELLTARVDLPGAVPVAVVATHLLPPWPYPAATWLREVTALLDLAGRLAPGPAATIVSGDFNAGLDNPQVRALLPGGFHDATEQAGGGYVPTYPTDRPVPPFLVLDHVVSRNADAADVSTVPLRGSDHRALCAVLQVASR